MVHDKIAMFLKDITALQNDLKDIKKEMKAEEKNDDEEYLKMRANIKDLQMQAKDMNESFLTELRGTELYQNLMDAMNQKQEELAKKLEAMAKLLNQLPKKHFAQDVDTENGIVKMQVQPEMMLYVNGKILKLS